MKKIKTELSSLTEEIKNFYDPLLWHFITLNGIDYGDGTIELQWIFAKYGVKDEVVVFYLLSDFSSKIPSITSLIPSAIMGEREVVDMFGVDITGIPKGLYLDEDSLTTPLRCSL